MASQKTIKKCRKFIQDIIKVYKKYGLSLAHEDRQGGFEIEIYSEDNEIWLEAAIPKEWENIKL